LSQHFLRQIEKLKAMMLELGRMAGQSVEDAIRAFEKRDADLAARVVAKDNQIDVLEVDVEEECLHTLALYQPVASDLRFVVALLTINKDLERIGDLAVNIAEQTLLLSDADADAEMPCDILGEARRVRAMLGQSLDALIEGDVDLALKVRESDDHVDRLHRQTCRQIEDAIRKSPKQVGRLLQLLSVARQLERIADHAVNIAEDVVYMERGEVLRHRNEHTSGERTSAAAAH
jgi:phosphate transport system protein